MTNDTENIKQTKHEQTLLAIANLRKSEEELKEQMLSIKYESIQTNAYTEMDSYVRMVAKGHSTGVLIEGSAGVGKTHRTIQICNELVGAKEVAYMDSFTTALALYVWLYQNRDKKVVILDDVAGLMTSGKVVAMLKGALWPVNGKRIISYNTTKPIKDETGEEVPWSFELEETGMIVLTNYLDKRSPHIQAVLSRINSCKVEVPKSELLKIMEHIVSKPYKDLRPDERKEVLVYLDKISAEQQQSFNLRTLFKGFQFKCFSNEIHDEMLWKTLLAKSLDKQDEMLIIEAILKDVSLETTAKKAKKYEEVTGLDKRTWFRNVKKYEALYGKIEKQIPKEVEVDKEDE